MKAIAELTIAGMREYSSEPLPQFEALLCSVFETYPAPFGQAWYGDLYREKARDPEWFAASLVINAEKEGEGARRLWQMAAETAEPATARQIRRHAVDEARHANLYLAMLGTTFPDCADEETTRYFRTISPNYRVKDAPEAAAACADPRQTLDGLVQMNIGELRTRIHQLMLEPVLLAYCPAQADRRKLISMLRSIIRDETKHIHYTAVLLEQAARAGHGKLVRDLMFWRARQFCELTLDEVGQGSFEGS